MVNKRFVTLESMLERPEGIVAQHANDMQELPAERTRGGNEYPIGARRDQRR